MTAQALAQTAPYGEERYFSATAQALSVWEALKPFMQVGGDLSSKEGWRIAAMIAGSAYGERGGEICEKLGICTAKEYKLLSVMAEKKVNAVSSTSAGRLFDAASAVLGIRRFSTFEGEASMALQFAAEKFQP